MTQVSDLALGASPQALIPGDPDALEAMASQLGGYAQGAGAAAGRLRQLETLPWHGQAAVSFQGLFGDLPARLQAGASGLDEASSGLRGYAAALREARQQAAHALALYEQAVAAQDPREATCNAAAPGSLAALMPPIISVPPAPSPVVAIHKSHAEAIWSAAQSELARQARRLEQSLAAATARIPHEATLPRQVAHQIREFASGLGVSLTQLESMAEISSLFLAANPVEFTRRLWRFDEGIVASVQHPVETGKQMVAWDLWAHNPAKALGEFAPSVALAFIGDGDDPPEPKPVAKLSPAEEQARSDLQELESQSGSHAVARHGPETTLEQQKLSLEKGIRPDGTIQANGLRSSSRFLSYQDMKVTIDQVQADFAQTGKGGGAVTVKFGRLIGNGYYLSNNSVVYGETSEAKVVFQLGKLKTAYPKLPGGSP